MENDTKNPIISSPPVVDLSGPGPESDKPVKRVKPLVEGINAPKSLNDIVFTKPKAAPSTLTPGEQELIVESPDFKENHTFFPGAPEGLVKKSNRLAKFMWFAIVFLILVLASYEVYGWYLGKNKVVYSGTRNPYQAVSSLGAPTGFSTTSSSTLVTATTTISGTSTSSLASSTVPMGNPLSTSSTSSAPGVVTPQAPKLTVNKTPTGYLNVRSQPSTSASIITKIHPGDVYPYANTQNGWYDIILPSGIQGWVSGQYVTVQ